MHLKRLCSLLLFAAASMLQLANAQGAELIDIKVEVSGLFHDGALGGFKQDLKDKARRLAIERATGTWVARRQRIEQGIMQQDSLHLQALGEIVNEREHWLPVGNEIVDGVPTAKYTLRLQAQVLPLPAPTLPITKSEQLPELGMQLSAELKQSWSSANPPQQRWRNWLQLVIDRMQSDPKLRHERQLFAELSRMMAENADEASFSAIPDDLAQQHLVRQLIAAAEAKMRELPKRSDYAWLAGNDFSDERAAIIESYAKACRQCDQARYMQQQAQRWLKLEWVQNLAAWAGIAALLLLCRDWRQQCLVSGRAGAYSVLSVALMLAVFWAPALGYITWLLTPVPIFN